MANRIAQATVGIDVDKSDLLKQINEALKSGQALANGAQINIDTNVDTSELKKQLQEAEKEVKRIQNKINSVDLSSLKSGVEKAYKTMDKNPDSDKFLRDFVKSFKEYIALGGKVKDLNEDIVEAYKLSDFDKEFVPIKKIKLLSDELQVAKDKVESLNSAIKSAGTGGFDSTSTQIKELQEQLDDLGKKYKELQEKMSKVKGSDVDLASNEQFTKLASNLAEVQKEIVDIKEEMKQFASNDNWADGAIKELIESYKRVNDEVQTVISSIQELRKLQSTPIVTKVEEKPTFESSKRESSSNDNTSQPNDINYLLDKDILEETFDDTIQAVQKFNSRLSKEKASLEKILLGMKEDFEELRNSDIDESFKEALTSDDYDSKDELYADFADQYYQRAQEWFYDRSSAIQDDKADGLYEDARDYDQYLASMADSYEKCLQMIDMIEDADLKAEKLSEYSKLYAEDINGDDKDRTKSLSLGRDALQTIVEDYEREAGKLNEQVNTIIADIDRLSKIEVQASWFETPDSVKSGISSDSIKEEKTELQGLIDEFTRLASLHEHMRTNMSGFSKSPTYTQESIQEVQTVYTELKQAMTAMNQLQINPEVNKDKILELSAYITELDKKFKVLATYNDSKQGDTLNYLGIAKEDHGLYFDANKYVLDWQVLSELMWDVSKKIREIDSTFEASSITINPEPFKEIIGLLNTIENKAEDITPLPSDQTEVSSTGTTAIDKEKEALKEVEAQAEKTEQAVKKYKVAARESVPQLANKSNLSTDDDLKKDKGTTGQVIDAEVQEFEKLRGKVKEVETAIEKKTNAITAEKIAMEVAAKSEADSLQNVINKVDELKNCLKELPEVKVPAIKVEEEKTEQGQIASGATHIQNNPKEAVKRGKTKGEKVDTSLTPEQLKARTDSLRKASEELEENLASQGSTIKSVTDFYDSQDNLVKTVLKEEKELEDGTKKATTWTTNYNLEKGTSFSSHIDTTKFADEEKALLALEKEREAQLKRVNAEASKDKNKASNDSYTLSVKWLKEIYSYEERIARAKETNSQKELEKVPYYQAQISGLRELLDTEQEYRKDNLLNTGRKDNNLNNKELEFVNEYKRNRDAYNDSLQATVDLLHEEALALNTTYDAEQAKAYKKEQEQAEQMYANMFDQALVNERKKETDNEQKNVKAIIDAQVKQYQEDLDAKAKYEKDAEKYRQQGIQQEADYYAKRKKLAEDYESWWLKSLKTQDIKDNNTISRFQNSANQSLVKFNIDFESSPNFSNVEEQLNKLKASVSSITDQEGLKRFNQELNQLGNSLRGVSDLSASKISNKIQKWLDDNTNASHELRAELERLQKELSETFVTKARGNEILKFLHDTDVATRKAGKSGDSFFEGWKKRMKNLALYLTSFASFYDVINKLREGVTVVRELDTALTEMRKVSDESVKSLKAFQKASFDIAETIGTTAMQIQNSTSDFLRLGYTLEEASKLAEHANIYANVGDMEIDEATEHMISSIKAWSSEFSSEVEASEAIINRYNEIGNNFAISSADIGVAMERSAAALKAGGNTLNESLGLLVSGNLIQQDAETTAAALKILALRIRGSKTELEEMGESTDGLVTSTSKLREEIKALTGVDIMLDENTYKSTAQIIKELGAVYNQLTDIQQATLLEKISGKNRASTVEGLLQNYQLIDEVIESAEQAGDSAFVENAKYLESIEARFCLYVQKCA